MIGDNELTICHEQLVAALQYWLERELLTRTPKIKAVTLLESGGARLELANHPPPKGQAFRAARVEADRSLREIAAALGISPVELGEYERGKCEPADWAVLYAALEGSSDTSSDTKGLGK